MEWREGIRLKPREFEGFGPIARDKFLQIPGIASIKRSKILKNCGSRPWVTNQKASPLDIAPLFLRP